MYQDNPQVPEHILQNCTIYINLRAEVWAQERNMEEKAWDSYEDLLLTADSCRQPDSLFRSMSIQNGTQKKVPFEAADGDHSTLYYADMSGKIGHCLSAELPEISTKRPKIV